MTRMPLRPARPLFGDSHSGPRPHPGATAAVRAILACTATETR